MQPLPPAGPWRIQLAQAGFVARRAGGPSLGPVVLHVVLDLTFGAFVVAAVLTWWRGGIDSVWWLVPLGGVYAWGIWARGGTWTRLRDRQGLLQLRCRDAVLETRARDGRTETLSLAAATVDRDGDRIVVAAADGRTATFFAGGAQGAWLVGAVREQIGPGQPPGVRPTPAAP